MKRSAKDRNFSMFIRARDFYTCQRCHSTHPPNSKGLHCAHMFTRRLQVTRFDPDNAVALCYGCHAYVDSHPSEKLAFFRGLLGDERFEALAARAHGKRNRKEPNAGLAEIERIRQIRREIND